MFTSTPPTVRVCVFDDAAFALDGSHHSASDTVITVYLDAAVSCCANSHKAVTVQRALLLLLLAAMLLISPTHCVNDNHLPFQQYDVSHRFPMPTSRRQ
jgi:hypothetical protein